MGSPAWWFAVAITVPPLLALAAGLIAYTLWLDRKIEEEERDLPPAE